MNKMRVWWIPQIGTKAFYVSVRTVEEAKKVMDILGAYDNFQYNQKIKPDYCNVGGLQIWDEDEQEWNDWEYEDEDCYYDNVDAYCEEKSQEAAELAEFEKTIFGQVTFD